MLNKQRKMGVATWIKVLLIVAVCSGITAAFIEIAIFIAAFTGWFICCIGLYVFTIVSTARAMWNGLSGEGGRKARRPRYRR